MRKVFLHVNCDFDPDGRVRPVSFLWEDGRWYEVDRILDRRRAPSLLAGGQGDCYTCRVLGRTLRLFRDDDKWYLEAPDPASGGGDGKGPAG
jgi:MoaA/NifB/PqqE/SkfB family radical SAM enzyme